MDQQMITTLTQEMEAFGKSSGMNEWVVKESMQLVDDTMQRRQFDVSYANAKNVKDAMKVCMKIVDTIKGLEGSDAAKKRLSSHVMGLRESLADFEDDDGDLTAFTR